MALNTQSTTFKGYSYSGGQLFIFTSSGVDIYKPSAFSFDRVGFASLANVTCGCVNDYGVLLGTSDRGVYHCPIGRGNLTTSLSQYFATVGTANLIDSDDINSISGVGTKILICHSSGAHYMPYIGVTYDYTDEETDNAAINSDGTKMAYSVASGLETLTPPSADWDSTDATVLTTGSSPALSSNTVNDLRYGSGNNLFIAGGSGIDIYDYTDVTNVGSGSCAYVWPTSSATQSAGDMAYVDSSSDVVLYDLATPATLETITGTYATCWLSNSLDLQCSDADEYRILSIDNITPVNGAEGVDRSWSLYFEIDDAIAGITDTNITVKVDGVSVSPTYTSITDGYKATYTPVSSSGYKKSVTIEISGTDDNTEAFSEEITFTTETSINESPTLTKPPSVIVYKDLSLTNSEDVYKSVNVNWLDDEQNQLYVDEDQCKAAAQVMVENGYYHKHVLSIQVYDTDDSSNNTQDMKVGDIITLDVNALGLTNQKCEVLSKQMVTDLDRILYNVTVVYYEAWS